jgi:ABC-type Fe3+/spermidine/putrescine transport system ATPase subunit
MAMSDRLAVLRAGRIEQTGAPEEIYSRPRSRFVADFIGESNFFDASLDGGGSGVVTLADGTRVSCSSDEVAPSAASVTLMVRPESIRIFDPAEAPPGSLRAETIQASFLGSYTRVAVRCGASPDPILIALQGKGAAGAEFDPDKEVALWWKPEDAVLIVEAGEEREEGGG